MLSEHLPFRQDLKALQTAFPHLTDSLTVVIEADSAERAEFAALELATALAKRREFFRFVFFADGHPFFRRHGLLFWNPTRSPPSPTAWPRPSPC